jgi:hypothetical protein
MKDNDIKATKKELKKVNNELDSLKKKIKFLKEEARKILLDNGISKKDFSTKYILDYVKKNFGEDVFLSIVGNIAKDLKEYIELFVKEQRFEGLVVDIDFKDLGFKIEISQHLKNLIPKEEHNKLIKLHNSLVNKSNSQVSRIDILSDRIEEKTIRYNQLVDMNNINSNLKEQISLQKDVKIQKLEEEIKKLRDEIDKDD